jgi:hypothetical protein
MRLEQWRNRLNQQQGEALFRAAVSAAKTKDRKTPASTTLLKVLSLAIVAIPVMLAVLGLWLVTLDFPNLITLVVGLVLLYIAWFLRPRRRKLPSPLLRRTDLPALFAVLDRI